MHKIKIQLKSADDVEEFLSVVSSFDCDVDIIVHSKTYDAKSLMVLMNLDFNQPFEVVLVSNSLFNQSLFSEVMQPFKYRG